MDTLFSIVGTLLMLVFLQAVLGFDNLLYISIESKRVAPDKQDFVRKVGIALAIVLRLVLLFVVVEAIQHLESPLFELNWKGVIEAVQECAPALEGAEPVCHGGISGHMLIVLFGGAFILYTAIKEVLHMMSLEEVGSEQKKTMSTNQAIFWIVVMNIVFSFDSTLGALALTDNFWLMAAAVVISGVMMIALANTVSAFLQKNRMYEVLGLFVLFLVGVMLVSEAGHLGRLTLMGSEVHAMPSSTFYFVLIVLVVVDVVQSRYQKKLNIEKQRSAQQLAELKAAEKAAA